MEHVDEEFLALVALGERVPGQAHIDSCPQCMGEVNELAAVVSTVRGHAANKESTLVLTAPAPSVWAAIHAELGLDAGVKADPLTAGSNTTRLQVAPEAPRLNDADMSGDADGIVVPLRARSGRRDRRSTWAFVGAAAAAGLFFGGIGTAWWQSRTPAPNIVAETALDALPNWTAEGNARVVLAKDGSHQLVVDMPTTIDDDGFREVWLIDRDVKRLVSLGVLTGTEGTFAIPAGLDLSEYPIVDISLESFDGDPAHSGDSIIRGTLPA